MAIRGCNECRQPYEVPNGGKVDHSHGYCPKCLRIVMRATFKKQQVGEGNPDCYLESLGCCGQTWCTYHPLCPNPNPTYADVEEVYRRIAERNKNGYGKGRVIYKLEKSQEQKVVTATC